MAHLSLTLLGPLEVALDGESITRFQSNKVRALLAYLATEADRPHRRDALATLLWPNSPGRAARANLRRALSNLRRVIGDHDAQPPFLTTTRDTIQFNSASDSWVDVTAYTALLTTGQPEEAVALYQGPFLEGFSLRDSVAFDDWTLLTQERLQRQALSALQRLVEQYERGGELERACQAAWRQVQLEPWHEGARRELMRLLALGGQRSAALAQYEACRRTLMEELGVEPTRETTALYERIRDGAELPASSRGPPHNLPLPLPPLIGRRVELAEIQARLRDPACRLLTVIGPGGIGKSRVAIQAAADQVRQFPHGVYLVNLAPIDSPDLLATTIMEALGVSLYGSARPHVQLLNTLRDKTLLLVLDNLEHLLQGTPMITQVLRAAPGLKLLVTSRERLNLREEWLLPLQGLDFPGQEEIAQESAGGREPPATQQPACVLEDYSAIQLFVQCARRVRPRFSLATASPSSVARVCQLVEGMPLAIELASPWAQVMPCRDIALEIERSLGFLSSSLRDMPERHRSMRAVFDHSWSLLTAEEREVLGKLSVFQGGFHREAAEAVAGASLPLLSLLVDKSWLRAATSGRYEVHELIRQYLAERLEADERVRDQHAEYFTTFLQQREANLKGWGQAEALREILADMDNVRMAWRWAVERGQVEAIKRCLTALWLAGETWGWYHEVEQAFDRAAAKLRGELSLRAPDGTGPAQGQAAILLAEILPKQAYFTRRLGSYARAKLLCEESLALLSHTPCSARQDVARADAKVTLGWVLLNWGQYAEAAQLFGEALALARAAGDEWMQGIALILLGTHAQEVGQYTEAEALVRQAIAASDRRGEQWTKAWQLHNLADALTAKGEYGRAEEAALESLHMHRQMRDRVGTAHIIGTLGELDCALGRYEQARRRYQDSLVLFQEMDNKAMQSWSLIRQGWLELALGRHAEAREQFQKGLALARELRARGPAIGALIGLGHATCALGELERSRHCLCEALEGTIEPGLRPEALNALVGLANISAKEDDLGQAMEMLALVAHHPASSQMTKDRAQGLLSGLASGLPLEGFAAAIERGQARDVDEVVAEILGARR